MQCSLILNDVMDLHSQKVPAPKRRMCLYLLKQNPTLMNNHGMISSVECGIKVRPVLSGKLVRGVPIGILKYNNDHYFLFGKN